MVSVRSAGSVSFASYGSPLPIAAEDRRGSSGPQVGAVGGGVG